MDRNMDPAPIPIYLVYWNAPEWIRAAVTSIRGSDVPVRIFVISNSGPVQVDGAEVIDTGANLGFTGGANRAFSHWLESDDPSPYAVVGTHDLHVAPDTVRLMVAAMAADGALGMCAPEMPDAPIVPARGAEGTEWLMGQCIMFRRECVEAVGGFDERFGTYGEDKDLSLRAWDAGWSVRIVPGASGHGLGSISTRARPLRLGNEVGLARKHRGDRNAAKLLIAQPILAIRDVARSVGHPSRARHHLRYALDRLRSIPLGVASFRRFGPGDP